MKNHFSQLIRYVTCALSMTLLVICAHGQTAGKLVINEIDHDQPSHDTAEFIEILNRSGASVDLSFYSIELINGTGGGSKLYGKFQLPTAILPARSYFVPCTDKATVPNCNTYLLKSIQNGAPDAVVLKLNNTLVDVVSYEGNSGPYYEGSGTGLLDPGTGGVGGQ